MYLGTLCCGYALNCLFVYLVIQGTRPLSKRKQKLFILFTCNLENEILICSNKHETGLVYPFDSLYYTVDSEIFARIFFFANSIKRHISDVKNSQLRQDLPISINDRVILPFREGFIFTKLRMCEVSRK